MNPRFRRAEDIEQDELVKTDAMFTAIHGPESRWTDEEWRTYQALATRTSTPFFPEVAA